MANNELQALFTGYGYEPLFVDITADPDNHESAHRVMADVVDSAYRGIRGIRRSIGRMGGYTLFPCRPSLRFPTGP